MIEVKDVSFQYSGAVEDNLTDITLKVKQGECVVLTGESGCGKTCVTRLINTLIPHFYEGNMTGSVAVNGVDTSSVQPHDFANVIGSVFQNPRSQFFSLDTDSEIVFGMENKGIPYEEMKKRYEQTVAELNIERLKNRNLFSLSGGEKQTIAFASIYALHPDIFVLDEPSSNLDPQAINELRRLLLLIKEQKKTILISEHRLYFLNGIVDRIIHMDKGHIRTEWDANTFNSFTEEKYQELGLRSFRQTHLELPETVPFEKQAPLLEVKKVSIGYEKLEVARDISFSLYSGEIVGLVGENGCGKTTLARTICGLQKELSGDILFTDKVVSHKKRNKSVYLVMQDPNYQLFAESVYQELALAFLSKKEKDEKKIEETLEKLNLTQFSENHPMALSGGQKQRTAIGVAALRNTDVLIFDEPTSGLDYKNMESVAKILKELSRQGKGILVISHDNELLMKICSRVIHMERTGKQTSFEQ